MGACMKILALVSAGATLALGAWLSSAQTGGWRPPEAYVIQSADSEGLSVRRASGGASCVLQPTGGKKFAAGPGCKDVADMLAGQLSLQDGTEGSLWLSDISGRIVLEFAQSEGGSYESVFPAEPLLLLDRRI